MFHELDWPTLFADHPPCCIRLIARGSGERGYGGTAVPGEDEKEEEEEEEREEMEEDG